MDPASFTPSGPGRIVRAPEGHWSFLPAPLPPEITLTAGIGRLLEAAEYELGQLAGTIRLLPNPGLLVGPFTRREAVLSSRIEGTTTTIGQLYLFEADHIDEAEKPDAREVRNHVQALHHGLEQLKTLPISLRLIREVHGVLLDGTRGQQRNPGEFRRLPVAIARAGESLHQARFVPPPVAEMHEALDSLERYINQPPVYPTLIDIALIHYQFETIHPFLDGNGRVGRLLIALLLHERGKLSEPLLYLSDYLDRHRDEYVDHLLRVSQEGTWLEWIGFVLQGVKEQARDGVRRSRRLLELNQDFRDRLHKEGLRGASLRLVDQVFVRPVFDIGQVADDLEVTFNTARDAVLRLVELGIIEEITGYQRNRVFAARELIRAIEEPLEEAEQ